MAIARHHRYAAVLSSGALAAFMVAVMLNRAPAAGAHPGDAASASAHDPVPTQADGTGSAATAPVEPPAPSAGRTVRALGRVQAKPELVARVVAPMWGRLEFPGKPIAVGQSVRKGEQLLQLILELNAEERYLMESRKVEIQAALAQSRTRRDQTERDFQRAVALLKAEPDDVLRRQQVQALERLLKAANEEFDLYQRQDKAFDTVIQRRDPRVTPVEAPISGVITSVSQKTGDLNPTGAFTELCTITDLSRVWIEAQVFERDIDAVLGGHDVRATFGTSEADISQPLGTPVAILPWIDEQTRTLKVIYEVANPGSRLPLGMTVHIALEVPSRVGDE
jgi:multidrug efflux pump subunit AcrA (membrane-fusion protein)